MLVVSILAPSIELICNSNDDTVLVIDLNEEEGNNEMEKKFEKNELFFKKNSDFTKISFAKKITKSKLALNSYSNFDAEVIPPPPKSFI